jgi:hypothetical protein
MAIGSLVALTVTLLSQTPAPAKPAPNPFGPPVRIGPYQFTLQEAWFSTRILTAETHLIADQGKKFLVLKYTVQNPSKTDPLNFYWASLNFTVVGADTDNHEDVDMAEHADKLTALNLDIKPLQTVPVLSYVQVPAGDPIHKLIIKSDTGEARYDLRGKTKKYKGIYAAPDGVTVLDEGTGKMNEPLEAGAFDLMVEKVEMVESPLGSLAADEGKKIVVATVAFTNVTKQNQFLSWSTFQGSMEDANGEPIESLQEMFRAVGNEQLALDVKPGQTVKGRMLFQASPESKPKKLRLTYHGEQRAIVVPIE